ncbi:MAG: sulfite exporter TauE/SafE family protein [Acidimicrobiales bacterium]|jgi:uncharacterized protein|nr:sulfite exporter TauE/SafE family protein [Acidimicrobiales bacterium]MDG1846279.1 sulfite exporter TauE/SafE family protein [Acidimicrobiales bacterium]
MVWWEAVLLFVGGGFAGVVNAMAGGGSSLTVPLLVLAGVPGNFANGTNRVGIFVSNGTTIWSFHRQGISTYREALPFLPPVVIGSLIGSIAISQVTDRTFETIFGILILPIIFLSLKEPKTVRKGPNFSKTATFILFLCIGIYAGAIQMGVGLVLLAILTRSGLTLMKANFVKVLMTLTVTMTALPVFIIQGKVRWLPAVILTCGLSIGGWIGARIAVKGGERTIRFFMIIAVIGLTGKLLGLYG